MELTGPLIISLTLLCTLANLQIIPAGLQRKSEMVSSPTVAGKIGTSATQALPRQIKGSKQKKGRKNSKGSKERTSGKGDGSGSNSYNGNSGYSVSSTYNRANRKTYGDSTERSIKGKGKGNKRGSPSSHGQDPGRYSQSFKHGYYNDPFPHVRFYK